MAHGLTFDIAQLLAGGLVLVSFLMITQHRLYALLNAFALQAMLLAMSVAWQANVQHAPHLYVTARPEVDVHKQRVTRARKAGVIRAARLALIGFVDGVAIAIHPLPYFFENTH